MLVPKAGKQQGVRCLSSTLGSCCVSAAEDEDPLFFHAGARTLTLPVHDPHEVLELLQTSGISCDLLKAQRDGIVGRGHVHRPNHQAFELELGQGVHLLLYT